MTIDYSERIPNNVNLANDRALQRALEHWQPHFLDWWREMGPNDFASADVYLRTATGVDAQGWASYGAVKMPDYRWAFSWPSPSQGAPSVSATTSASPCGNRCQAICAPSSAASSSRRATPSQRQSSSSISSAIAALPCTICATCSR